MDFDTYNIISGHDHEFELITTTNENIFKVCRIPTRTTFKTQEERVYYADIGEIEPTDVDEAGNRLFEFENLYNSKAVYYAALAEALFYDFPKILKKTNTGFEIENKKLNAKIDRGQVMKAFENWLGKFSENPYEVKGFLSLLAGSPQLATMLMSQVTNQHLASTLPGMNETSKNGEESFLEQTDTGGN